MTVLVTGAAGFIGMHVAKRLLDRGEQVIGIDNVNSYYDTRLKEARIARLERHSGFRLERIDIADSESLAAVLRDGGADSVVHLAAQAGVRYSIENPFPFERSNLAGHLSVLEACRFLRRLKHLVYASSSSVYGDRPVGSAGFLETDPTEAPVSLYAATKRACELMTGTYAHLYGLPASGLRFFSVYGPWGRPDMAYFEFTKRILAGEAIKVFGEGLMARDFTYIDDIVDGILDVLDRPPSENEHRIFNIGNSTPVVLMDMISILERELGRTAKKNLMPMQSGDVLATHANVSKLHALSGYAPKVPLKEGLHRFVQWYVGHFEGDLAVNGARAV